jgi:hypothetical protein
MNEIQSKILDRAFAGEWITLDEIRQFGAAGLIKEPLKFTKRILNTRLGQQLAKFGRYGIKGDHIGERVAHKAGRKAGNTVYKGMLNTTKDSSKATSARGAESTRVTNEMLAEIKKVQPKGTGEELTRGAFRVLGIGGVGAAGINRLKGERQFKIVYLDPNGNVRTGTNKARTKKDSLEFFQANVHAPGNSGFKAFKTPEEDAQARDYEMALRQSSDRQFGLAGLGMRAWNSVKGIKPGEVLRNIKIHKDTVKRVGAVGTLGAVGGLAVNADFVKEIPKTINDVSGKNIINVPGLATNVYRVVFRTSQDQPRSTTIKSTSKGNAIKALKSNPMSHGGTNFRAFLTPDENKEASDYELQIRYS